MIALCVVMMMSAKTDTDASRGPAKQNAIYMRPFITSASRVSIGGYTEFNVNRVVTDGVSDGVSFEFQRFNLFVYSPINKMVRLLAELEFEHGTDEIALETALVDFTIMPELTLRAGIILTPLGLFNQAHDGPLWDFVRRPLVSTTIIPATFSEVGVGAIGTFIVGPLDLDYQFYVTQGLNDGIVDNPLGRTSIPNGKGQGLFEEDNNGSPALTGRLALRYDLIAELGVSGYFGAYNTSTIDGVRIDERRDLFIGALDYRFSTRFVEMRGEAVYAAIDVPSPIATTLGDRQWGLFVDVIVPLVHFSALKFEDTKIEVGTRFEHVDYNATRFASTNQRAGDEITRVTGVAAWRLSASTVLRVNYGYDWITDRLRSGTSRASTGEIGFATYF